MNEEGAAGGRAFLLFGPRTRAFAVLGGSEKSARE